MSKEIKWSPRNTSHSIAYRIGVFEALNKAQGKAIMAAMENKLPHCLATSWTPSLAQAKLEFGSSPSVGTSFLCLVNQNASQMTMSAKIKTQTNATISDVNIDIGLTFSPL